MTSPPIWDAIPAELKSLRRWVLWKNGVRDGKPTKIPIRADNGFEAKANESGTWTTFEDAKEAFEKGQGEGIGFVFYRTDNLCGIDLDHCIGPDGEIDAWAQEYARRLDSYTEISPSGTGLHVLCRGVIPVTSEADGGKNKKFKGDGYRPDAGVEMYSNGHYLTVTGRAIPTLPQTMQDRQDAVQGIFDEVFGTNAKTKKKTQEKAQDGPRTDQSGPADIQKEKEKVFKAIFKSKKSLVQFLTLHKNGDTSAYGEDDSAADLALCNLLAFYCNKNPVLIDAIFRESKLMRDKWDEPRGGQTYGQMTISKAIEDTKEGYQSGGGDGEDEDEDEGGRGRPSALKRIINMLLEAFAQDSDSRLIVSTTGTYHLWIQASDHREMFDINSERFRIWLAGKFAETYNGAILRTSAIKDGREALISLLMRVKPPVKMDLQVKTLKIGDSIYYDLGREDWKCIRISPDGVYATPAPMGLRRTKAQGEQIEPDLTARPEDLDLLTDKMRIKDEADALLIKAYACAGMMPSIAHPILWLTGGQGSGKSMRAGMLKSVIDPATLKQTSLPDNRKDLGVLLSNAYCQGIDNVDAPFTSWQVEMLCQAVTGGASVARELFSDGEIAINVFNKGVLIFTSIAVVSNAPDLIDRAILMPVDELPEDERRSEVILMQEFDQDKPRILGAAFESISKALSILPEVQAEFERGEWPGVRMLDFAIFGEALARGAWGKEPGAFLEAYRKRISEASAEIVGGDLSMSTLQEFMRERIVWTGSAKALLRELERMNLFEAPDWRPPSRGWPKTPNALGMRLIKYSTDLARQGIKINRDRQGKSRDRIYEIELTEGTSQADEDEKARIEQIVEDHERRGTPLKIKEFAFANNLDKTELARLIHSRGWKFADTTKMYLPPTVK